LESVLYHGEQTGTVLENPEPSLKKRYQVPFSFDIISLFIKQGGTMETLDSNTMALFIFRWIHYVAGITWIGILYFFNFINVHFAKTLDGDSKKKVVPELMPRALWWFRWSAMFTWLSGLGYIIWKIFIATDAGFSGTGGLFNSTWGYWISLGGLLGTIMWFNVWFIIWPAQKKIIGWIKAGESPSEMPDLVKRATLASKANTFLSIPMLFCMGAASHFPSFSWVTFIVVLIIGFVVAKFLISSGGKVKTAV